MTIFLISNLIWNSIIGTDKSIFVLLKVIYIIFCCFKEFFKIWRKYNWFQFRMIYISVNFLTIVRMLKIAFTINIYLVNENNFFSFLASLSCRIVSLIIKRYLTNLYHQIYEYKWDKLLYQWIRNRF